MGQQQYRFILFGATGDLAYKKLIPALYQAIRYHDHLSNIQVLCLARSQVTTQEYLEQAKDYIIHSEVVDFDQEAWEKFSKIVTYHSVDVNYDKDYEFLKADHNRFISIYYLSLASWLFEITIKNLAANDLINSVTRLVIEKPLGLDLGSAKHLNSLICTYFSEHQIFRIDHYLGKESVQNLMALRFGNRLFEPLWNRTHIRSVQILIAEQDGIGTRGQFYNQTGALRDMVQNHLLQLLCFVAMEPPYILSADAIRDEKLKILRTLRQYSLEEAQENSVFGQYQAGIIQDKRVNGYLDEADIPKDSTTETYFAGKMLIDNWRWAGVPFYVRTGKRLPYRKAEIVVYFRNIPHHLFPAPTGGRANKLVISLQPYDTMDLYLMAKPPGQGNDLQPVKLSLDFEHQLAARRPTAYERLLVDVIDNNLSLFVRQDELEEAWLKIDPFLHLKEKNMNLIKPYIAGSWGPSQANELIARDHDDWHENKK